MANACELGPKPEDYPKIRADLRDSLVRHLCSKSSRADAERFLSYVASSHGKAAAEALREEGKRRWAEMAAERTAKAQAHAARMEDIRGVLRGQRHA